MPNLRAHAYWLAPMLVACASAAPSDVSDGTVLDDAASTSTDLEAQTDLAKNDAGTTSPGGACNPNNRTLGAAGGPDACAYGKVCSATTSTCVPPPPAACAMGMGAPVWNTSAQQAPVISKVSATLLQNTNATTECANGDPAALVTVEFYAPKFLTTKDATNAFLQQVKFKKAETVTGTWFDATFLRSPPVKSQQFGSFQVGINCGGAAGVSKTAAIYLVDEGARTSNVVCVSW